MQCSEKADKLKRKWDFLKRWGISVCKVADRQSVSIGARHSYRMVQGRPLLEKKMMNGIDPRLDRFYYIQKEAECLMYAGSLCISPIRLSQNRYLQCLRLFPN
ncbi:hypothetical protein Pint_21405 [Pistacia integerrima]|uniref:Uncharacterized protein n=1 Tax=Pistacia integerrima TaxID=434235 RepID=A0ACC0X9V7_9ROSI|nr:hypothetical protein Pint_21405 [Pistacia integerrima]